MKLRNPRPTGRKELRICIQKKTYETEKSELRQRIRICVRKKIYDTEKVQGSTGRGRARRGGSDLSLVSIYYRIITEKISSEQCYYDNNSMD